LRDRPDRGIFACAKTGYVVVRIEPGNRPPVSPLSAALRGFQRLSYAHRGGAPAPLGLTAELGGVLRWPARRPLVDAAVHNFGVIDTWGTIIDT